MTIQYVDQSAQELRLSVVQGAVNTKALNVIASSTLPFEDFSLEAAIIGASHYVQITTNKGDVLLTEVLACIALDVDNTLVNSVRNVGSFGYVGSYLSYLYESHRGSSTNYGMKYASLMEKATIFSTEENKIGIIHVFPTIDKTQFMPATVVCVDAGRAGFIYIDTVHAYPNEDMLVFTKTVITY